MTRSRLLALLPTCAAAALAACASSAGANRPLPSYAGHATELFDDSVDPSAVGLDIAQRYDPRTDAAFRERAQLSDAVLRVRVTTLTEKHDGPDTFYQLGVRTLETLGGPYPPSEDFLVSIGPKSPSAGILRNLGGAVVGKTFVAFVRAFVLPDGDRELHFHFVPDNKADVAAVKEAMQSVAR